MKRRYDTLACFCAVVLALTCSVAAKKHQFKTARPMEDSDSAPDAPKAEAVAPPPGSVSKIPPATRAVSVMVIDARSGEIFYEKNADAP
ncbi:MAG TPA: hypothetical protein VGH00_01770, partial [Chthoniobacterales bacterium]